MAAAAAGRTPCGPCRRRRGTRPPPDSRVERLQPKPGCQADSKAQRRKAMGDRRVRGLRLRLRLPLPRQRRRCNSRRKSVAILALRRVCGQRPLPSPLRSLGLPLPISASSRGGRFSSTSAQCPRPLQARSCGGSQRLWGAAHATRRSAMTRLQGCELPRGAGATRSSSRTTARRDGSVGCARNI